MARKARTAEVEVENPDLASVLDGDDDAALERILAQSGVKKLSETYDGWSDDNVLSTGIVALDAASGIGGYPKGRMVEIYGDESAGKTTAFLHTVVAAQRAGMPVVYIDAENALDLAYCARLGVDVDKMLVNQPESLEEAMDLMIKTMKREKTEGGKKGKGVLFVFDSVPAIKSMEVMEKGAGERSMMAEANRWAENGPKLITLAAATNSILLLVNQTRADTTATNARYAKKQTPGGKFIKFAASLRLEISAKRVMDESDKKEPKALGQETKVKFVKNKVGGPGKVAEYFLPAGKPVDWAEDVIDSAIQTGVVLADTKYNKETGELESSKNAFTLPLRDGWLDLINEDELDIWIDNGEFEAEERGDGENLNTVENFVSSYDLDTEYISVRFKGKFVEELADFERLLDAIEKAVREKVRERKEVGEVRKTRPDRAKLETKRLLSVAERRALAEKAAQAKD